MFGLWLLLAAVVAYFAIPTVMDVWTTYALKKLVAHFVHTVRQLKASGDDRDRAALQAHLDAAAAASAGSGGSGGGSGGGAAVPGRIVAIVNPHGGMKKAKGLYNRVFEPMCRALGVAVELRETTCAGHAIELARRAAEDPRIGLIVCFSGDGMVHEAIEGVMEAGTTATGSGDNRMLTPIAIMPCGSSNGLAMSLYDTVDPFECASKILTNCQARRSSLVSLRCLGGSGGDAGREHFDVMGVSQAVVGDANYICEGQLRWMNNLPLGVAIKELLAAVYLITLSRKYHIRVAMRCLPVSKEELAGDRYRDPRSIAGMTALNAPPAGASPDPEGTWYSVEDGWMWCETANVSHIAKDCQPSPGLKPSDPHMDVVLSRGHTRVQLAASFLRSEQGTHVHDKWFHLLKVAEVVFTPTNPAHEYYMSGERVATAGQPAVCRCVPDKGVFWH